LRKRAEGFDWSDADAMTDEQITEAAKADPDAQPVSKEWFERAAKRRAARKTAAE
jgi:hypothetical protein